MATIVVVPAVAEVGGEGGRGEGAVGIEAQPTVRKQITPNDKRTNVFFWFLGEEIIMGQQK